VIVVVFSCNFEAIPRTITSGVEVRFFPRTEGTANEVSGAGATPAYHWIFGDGDTSDVANPVHTYPSTPSPTSWNVTLIACDSSGATCEFTINDFIASDDEENIPGLPTGGSFFKVCVILRKWFAPHTPVTFTILSRGGNIENPMRLLKPVSTDEMDRIGTLRFSVLDIGTATQTQIGYLEEGVDVTFIVGYDVAFTGIIRRVTKNTQCGFSSTNRVNMWDIECDSDLARLRQSSIVTAALSAEGDSFRDTPGYLVRRVLTPDSGVYVPSWGDHRGVISCIDMKVAYQLNSSTSAESAGSRYEHLDTIHNLTNYDLRSRGYYKVFRYDTITEAEIPPN
jgi:hypothetical protein